MPTFAHDNPLALSTVLLAAGCSGALGLVVLFGWHTGHEALIQISSAFVPMQYNTALSFLLTGLGLAVLALGHRASATGCGMAVAAIGGVTLRLSA